ncbi:hypothetical protein ARAM_007503 [Aspergillus rambellii]|uniref:Glycosyl transferase CAP10 domain-containing protein n=1 Tax=Aspergillus rambellii TaxID=308745 RepID=A0A0F8XN89_9EURO|nr:hypothetical protein ARAM_007503 [Aspergillus rambellii]
MFSACSRWHLRGSLLGFFGILGGLGFTIALVLWYAVNSDRDYYHHPILTQLLPAGHCACRTTTVFECSSCLACSSHDRRPCLSSPSPAPIAADPWEFEYTRDGNNAGLSRRQCSAAFPGLFEDIIRARSYWTTQGGLSSADLDAIPFPPGMARARIARGELYVLRARARGEDHRRKIVAALSAMHRALVADPDRVVRPDIEFVFSVEDKVEDIMRTPPEQPVWVLARAGDEEAVWLIPDFGYWAWDQVGNEIGPYDQVVDQAIEYDRIPWSAKQRQLVWRGKPSFAPKLRRALMDATRDQTWADVQPVDWNDRSNVLSMEDHCKYMFIAHVEGRSYSASLKYRQACRSVIVAHRLQYIQHHHYLLISSARTPLNDDPRAELIASNSVRTFRERYLTAAAEACYWRSLWDGYGAVWNGTEGGSSRRGLRFESFLLQGSEEMVDFRSGDFSRGP